MPNPWFRAYAEFASDPKVQMMSEALQRRLHMLMCFRCNETLETLHETELAFALRISQTELSETKMVFVAKGFIDENWKLLNWDKRQFASDSSTPRVRAHREKKKNATLFDETDEKRSSNGPEQNRTEQKPEKKELALPEFISRGDWDAWIEMRKKMKKPATDHALELAANKLAKWHVQGYDTAWILQQSILNCWTDVYCNEGKTPKRKIEYRPVTREDNIWGEIGAQPA